MAAPPPPPPPPPPGAINVSKPENKKLLDSICKGTSLKKVPDSMKKDRSEALLNKPQGTGNSKNNSGPLVPPSNKTMTFAEELAARKNQKAGNAQIAPQGPPLPPINKPMTLNEEIAARKNQKSTDLQPAPQSSPIIPNPKQKSGAPLPNSLPPPVAPPPPSATNKPSSIAQPQATIKIPMNLPPPPMQTHNPTGQPPPPPLPNIPKPNFRQPIPICSKPTTNGDSQTRFQSNKFCGPIIPPPPPMLPSSTDIRPPRFGPPPPPPPSTMPIQAFKPEAPLRVDSRCDFDSKFTFMEMKYFPDPNTMIKIRQT